MIRSVPAAALPRPRRADPPLAFAVLRFRLLGGSISPTAANAIAQAIQTQEGYYPGSLAYQNNNPGNLVYAGQAGATPGAGGFADFASYSDGYNALVGQIQLDATRGTDVNGNPTSTLSQLISSWAPPSENDTAAYIASVSAATGYDPSAPLSSLGSPYTVPTVSPVDGSDTASLSLPISIPGLDSTVDLSSIGLPSDVPVPLLVGVGLVGAFALSQLL